MSELATNQNADHPTSVLTSSCNIDYAAFQIVSRADATFFAQRDCTKNGNLDTSLDAAERNFFFAVYNTKWAIRPSIEAATAIIISNLRSTNKQNNNVIHIAYRL